MAIKVRQPIKINPIDTTDKVAVGLKLPFGRRGHFTLDYTTKDHAKSKLINVLLTVPGERINQPNFGVGLKERIFDPNTEDIQDSLRSSITSQIGIYVPEITVENITFKEEDHILYLSIIYKVIANSEKDSVTLSFSNTNFESNL